MAETWADKIAEFLERRGIRHAFGVIGAGNAGLFDAIGRRGFTQIVCTHHEQAATMAMQTYYRASGQIAAVLLTTGGGSTNGVTGVTGAWMDSIPGLVIAGNENSRFAHADNPLRVWGVQGYDSVAMVAKVTKYAKRVGRAEDTVLELETACDIALSGRPGPVWIEIPLDLQAAPHDPATAAVYTPPPPRQISAEVRQAAALALEKLRTAKRPILWLGHGVRLAGAADRAQAFVEALGVPVLLSWAGIDVLDSNHPLAYGRAGVYGHRAGNFVLQNADLVVAIGTRLAVPQIGYVLDELVRDGTFVVVDADAAETVKHGAKVSLPVVADAGDFIDALMEAQAAAPLGPPSDWIARCDDYRARYPWLGPEHADQPPFLNSYGVVDRLIGHLKPDQVITTDVGTAFLSAQQMLKLKPGQRLMCSTGLGEMGWGLPAAVGASFARAEDGHGGEVLCLNCDGGIMMNLQELQTVAHHHLPIKIIIFNNDGYLSLRHTQNNLYKGRKFGVDPASGLSCPDFRKVAAAFDIPYLAVRDWADFDAAIPAMQAADGPVICEVFTHPEQLFVPKLSLAPRPDGSIVSPPIEDLSPLLPRQELIDNMIVGAHPKSLEL
jgi:acetolactate synthase-1/2/3 large subunit